jgi:hypothetical protein
LAGNGARGLRIVPGNHHHPDTCVAALAHGSRYRSAQRIGEANQPAVNEAEITLRGWQFLRVPMSIGQSQHSETAFCHHVDRLSERLTFGLAQSRGYYGCPAGAGAVNAIT